MLCTYHYRLIKASWGIAVDIAAEAEALPPVLENIKKVDKDLWLGIDIDGLSHSEHEYLALGLRLVAEEIRKAKQISGPILVRVLDLRFNPSDYQPEGLSGAIAGWAGQAFGFAVSDIPVTFDKQNNRYIFQFKGA